MNVFFHLLVGMAKILSMGLSDQCNSFLYTDLFISLTVEELFFVKQRKSICHVQPTTTCEPWLTSKICLQDLILQA